MKNAIPPGLPRAWAPSNMARRRMRSDARTPPRPGSFAVMVMVFGARLTAFLLGAVGAGLCQASRRYSSRNTTLGAVSTFEYFGLPSSVTANCRMKSASLITGESVCPLLIKSILGVGYIIDRRET
jgi:hypothetical protein